MRQNPGGRPRLPEGRRKVKRLQVVVTEDQAETIDRLRGEASVSEYISGVLAAEARRVRRKELRERKRAEQEN